MLPFEYDVLMETYKWSREIPYIKFPSDWEIKISPPFGGATVRFRVRKGDAEISIYLDCYDRLGSMGVPYWEIYPNAEGEPSRFNLNDVDDLLKAIQESIDSGAVM